MTILCIHDFVSLHAGSAVAWWLPIQHNGSGLSGGAGRPHDRRHLGHGEAVRWITPIPNTKITDSGNLKIIGSSSLKIAQRRSRRQAPGVLHFHTLGQVSVAGISQPIGFDQSTLHATVVSGHNPIYIQAERILRRDRWLRHFRWPLPLGLHGLTDLAEATLALRIVSADLEPVLFAAAQPGNKAHFKELLSKHLLGNKRKLWRHFEQLRPCHCGVVGILHHILNQVRSVAGNHWPLQLDPQRRRLHQRRRQWLPRY
mmetsp:Transcript_54174/g.123250  ORF Transcript_54174/g.123250 Transcript_54174/m.123250 type:complete len:257 (-) Transcript_54174:212-982(-)